MVRTPTRKAKPPAPPAGPPDLTTLAGRLRHARELAGLSQDALADAIGVKQQTVGAIENGGSEQTKHVVRLALALKVRPEWLDLGLAPMAAAPRTLEWRPMPLGRIARALREGDDGRPEPGTAAQVSADQLRSWEVDLMMAVLDAIQEAHEGRKLPMPDNVGRDVREIYADARIAGPNLADWLQAVTVLIRQYGRRLDDHKRAGSAVHKKGRA